MLDFGIFSLVNLSMECSCMAPLTPVVMIMMGLVFHPLLSRVLINAYGSYFMCFRVRACYGNMSWQCVNSIYWIVRVESDMDACVWLRAHVMHRIGHGTYYPGGRYVK